MNKFRNRMIMESILSIGLIVSVPLTAGTEDVADELLSGDLASKRNSLTGIQELITQLEETLETDPDDYDANWKYSAMLYFYGDFYVENAKTKKEYFTKSKTYAEKAVELNSTDAAGHYWLGVAYAMWSQANGILKSLFYADDVVKEMTKCIKYDPSYFKGTPYAIRAKVYAFAPSVISVGDMTKAYADIETALQYGADYRVIYQIAAEVYIQNQDWDKASEVIETGLSFPIDSIRELEDTKCKETLEEYEETVEGK